MKIPLIIHMTNQSNTTEQQTTHREFVESFRQMALEKTDNGGVILDFLVSAVKGEFPDFKPNHKLEAVQDCSKSSQA